MTPTTHRRARIERLKADLPRHLAGMVIAMAVGALAVIGALWATNPGADAMLAEVDAEPTIGIDSSRVE